MFCTTPTTAPVATAAALVTFSSALPAASMTGWARSCIACIIGCARCCISSSLRRARPLIDLVTLRADFMPLFIILRADVAIELLPRRAAVFLVERAEARGRALFDDDFFAVVAFLE